jgi:predicted molibdopterin-dependent oxidoreductase YjgC
MVDMMLGTLKVYWVACQPRSPCPFGQAHDYLASVTPAPFVVVQDIFDPMESMAYADLFLPAAQWGEKTGTYTCSERRVNLGRKAVQPVGYELRPAYGAYSDLEIIKMVADKLASFDARFRDQAGQSLVKSADPETVFNEWKQVSAGKICDMSGMTYANLATNNGIAWPSTPANVLGGKRLPTASSTPTGTARSAGPGARGSTRRLSRVYLWAVDYVPPPEVPDAPIPSGSTPGVIEHFHSRTKTKRVAQLHEMVPENYVEISTADAKTLRIVTGNLVKVTSRRGTITVKAKVTDTVRTGAVFIPMHFGDIDPTDVAQNGGRQVAVNRLTMNYVDKDCGQPIYKHCAVKLAKA